VLASKDINIDRYYGQTWKAWCRGWGKKKKENWVPNGGKGESPSSEGMA